MKMPGINSKNVYMVMNRVENLSQLVKLSVAELTEILGSSGNAELLHNFIHASDQLPRTDTAADTAACSKVVKVAGKSKLIARRKSPRKK